MAAAVAERREAASELEDLWAEQRLARVLDRARRSHRRRRLAESGPAGRTWRASLLFGILDPLPMGYRPPRVCWRADCPVHPKGLLV